VHHLEEITHVEDVISLAFAADEFLLELLTQFCITELEKLVTLENVWPTLNSLSLLPKVAAACSKVTNQTPHI